MGIKVQGKVESRTHSILHEISQNSSAINLGIGVSSQGPLQNLVTVLDLASSLHPLEVAPPQLKFHCFLSINTTLGYLTGLV